MEVGMNVMKLSWCLGLAAAALCSAPADATVTININEVGSDIVATASGSLDLTGLVSLGDFNNNGYDSIVSAYAVIEVGVPGPPEAVAVYSTLPGPSNWGSVNVSGGAAAASYAGTQFGIVNVGSGLEVDVPVGYTSGSTILGTSTFLSQSFASLELVPGQYVYTGPNDEIIVNIGPISSAVPEPSTWAMMLLGIGAVGLALRRRTRAQRHEPGISPPVFT
jgi:PEP-CTERM motif-containing protein